MAKHKEGCKFEEMIGSLRGATVRPIEGGNFSGTIGIPIGFRKAGESDNDVALRYLEWLDTQEEEGRNDD